MVYRIRERTKFYGPYNCGCDDAWAKHATTRMELIEETVYSTEMLKKAVFDMLDCWGEYGKDEEASREAVRKSFESIDLGPLPSESVDSIVAYFKFRREKQAEIYALADRAEREGESFKPEKLRFDIPGKLSGYDVYKAEDGEYAELEVLEHWFEVAAAKTEEELCG